METKAPSSTDREMSDSATWSWRVEVRNTCETPSISIMAAAFRAGACPARGSDRDGKIVIPASLAGVALSALLA
jgi:hypothetical protein